MKREDKGGAKNSGQSLVELVILLPVLILLLVGLVEVGMALHSYLIVTSASRDAARFGARGTFTDVQIARHAKESSYGQLDFRTYGPDANTTIIVTRLHIGTELDNMDDISYTVYITGLSRPSRVDPLALATLLKEANDDFNRTLLAEHPDALPSAEDVVIVEVYYDHPQVLGAPFIADILPNPITLYAQTMMRITGVSRIE